MISIVIIYGFEFLNDSPEFIEFITRNTDCQSKFKMYVESIQNEKEHPLHKNTRKISLKDFCQSEHFDPYNALTTLPHVEGSKNWTTTFIKGKPDANFDSMTYYIHGISIDFKTSDIETDINFGSIQDLINKIPKQTRDHILDQQNTWNWPYPPKIYYKSYNFQ